jgi:hypothetical protein
VVSFNQDSERIGQISTRLYVNSLQSTGSCSLNVFKAIVKEHNTVGRHADCPDNIVVRLGFGLSQPNRRRHVDLSPCSRTASSISFERLRTTMLKLLLDHEGSLLDSKS